MNPSLLVSLFASLCAASVAEVSAAVHPFLSSAVVYFCKNHPDDSKVFDNIVNRDIVKECLYQTETLGFNSSANDIQAFELKSTKANVYKKVSELYAKKQWTNYWTMISSQAAGLFDGITCDINQREMAILAEQSKKPIPTRIGKLLRQQHEHWMSGKGLDTLRKITASPYIKGLTPSKPEDYHLLVFFQALMIFGFVNPDDMSDVVLLMKQFQRSRLFKEELDNDRMMFTTIDRILTLMVHDPIFQPIRRDNWSTLPGFELAKNAKCETDLLVEDFMCKVFKKTDFKVEKMIDYTRPKL